MRLAGRAGQKSNTSSPGVLRTWTFFTQCVVWVYASDECVGSSHEFRKHCSEPSLFWLRFKTHKLWRQSRLYGKTGQHTVRWFPDVSCHLSPMNNDFIDALEICQRNRATVWCCARQKHNKHSICRFLPTTRGIIFKKRAFLGFSCIQA